MPGILMIGLLIGVGLLAISGLAENHEIKKQADMELDEFIKYKRRKK